jgi:hypothetical protein
VVGCWVWLPGVVEGYEAGRHAGSGRMTVDRLVSTVSRHGSAV